MGLMETRKKALSIHPNDDVRVCCGHAITSKAREILTIGNIEEETLGDMIKRMDRNILYWWIFLEGPVKFLNEINCNYKIKHICQACFLLGTKCKNKLLSLSERKMEIFDRLLLNKSKQGVV